MLHFYPSPTSAPTMQTPQESTIKNYGEEPGFPSAGVRTFLTFLLFFHFFAIFAGISGNFGARSGLRRQLRASPGVQPYLHTLGLDTGYDHGIISNTADDWDHLCQIVVNPPANFDPLNDDAADLQKVNLIPAGSSPWGMQKRRYLTLAGWLAAVQGDDNEEAALVSAIAGGMLRKAEVESGAHRFLLLAQRTQDMISLEEMDPVLRDPNHSDWFDTLYNADLILDEDRWSPSTRGGRGEMTQSRATRGRDR